mmetsp:Transcript_104797/g.271493  ORF Transcript_104797/g.271493 Transcript_104797/m.271493 type:complete len:267 (-) Transcript_104797:217-1017(-)
MRHSLLTAHGGTVCATRATCTIEGRNLPTVGAISAQHAPIYRHPVFIEDLCFPDLHLRGQWRVGHRIAFSARRRRWPGHRHGILSEDPAPVKGHPQHARISEAELQSGTKARDARYIREVEVKRHARRRPTPSQNARAKRRAKRLDLRVALARVPEPDDDEPMLLGSAMLWLPAFENTVSKSSIRIAVKTELPGALGPMEDGTTAWVLCCFFGSQIQNLATCIRNEAVILRGEHAIMPQERDRVMLPKRDDVALLNVLPVACNIAC